MENQVSQLSQERYQLAAPCYLWCHCAASRNLHCDADLSWGDWVSNTQSHEGISRVVALLEVNPNVELKPESVYRLIIVAGVRSKQLQRGSTPRIEPDVLKRKNTSIALEEVRLGLVRYTIGGPKQRINSTGRHEAG